MKVLVLDLSSKKSGYSLFEGKTLIDNGCWELFFEEESDWRKRVVYMGKKVNDYMGDHNVKMVYVEDVPPIQDNSQTVKVLSALQGCILTLCSLKNIDCEIVGLSWKSKVGIDLTHSSQFKKKCKENKGDKMLHKFKDNVKCYEKKLSVDYANHLFDLNLQWKSNKSKFNEDDKSDSILIGVSKLLTDKKYDLNTIDNIIDFIWEKTNEKRGAD